MSLRLPRSRTISIFSIVLLVLVVVYFVGTRTTKFSIDRSEVIVAPASKKSAPEEYAFGFHPSFDYSEQRAPCKEKHPLKKAFFGDLHVHTAISADAYPDGTRTYPDDAYRFAKGEAISLPVPEGVAPRSVMIDQPIDFAAVTDHAESMGEGYICRNQGLYPGYNSEACETFRGGGQAGVRVFHVETAYMQPERNPDVCGDNNADCIEATKIVWQEMIDSAERAYDKSDECQFTSFVGYEYTRSTNSNHLHRNTIYKNAAVPEQPASFMDFPSLHLLLGELEASCRVGIETCDVMSIPHNSNISGGNAFNPKALAGYSSQAQQAHRLQRNAFDRLAEITQHKGASECQNGFSDVLSDTDEYCDVEAIRKLGKTDIAINLSTYIPRYYEVETKECTDEDLDSKDNIYKGYCLSSRDYLRGALLAGMQVEQQHNVNPFEFGIIASSDTHLSTPGQTNEAAWQGHIADETTLENRLGEGALGRNNRLISNPGGLAGVWAVENSRDALFHSMKRREAFGTSGTRIEPRFFIGRFDENLCEQEDWLSQAYEQGTPMGSKVTSPTTPFQLLAQANRDPSPSAAGLAQLQIIKGWVDSQGIKRAEVIDVAAMQSSDSNGEDSLCTVYRDPQYEHETDTYYYLRVVEAESDRWSKRQCEAFEAKQRPTECDNDSPTRIREFAWTSPIWVSPRVR